eukprot:77970_1
MGCSVICCTTCNTPRTEDHADGRRKILNDHINVIQKMEESYDSSSVRITQRYIEKPDGMLLFSKLFEPKDPRNAKAMICYSPGFTDHISWLTHGVGVKYAQLGFVVFMVDWKGHGRSDGQYIHIADFETDVVDEAIWAFNYAINKYIKTNDIYAEQIDKHNNYFLNGMSMGGAITINVALKSIRQQQQQTTVHYEDEKNDLGAAFIKDYENTTSKNSVFTQWKGIVVACPMIGFSKEQRKPDWLVHCLGSCCVPCCPKAKVIPNKVGAHLTRDKELELLLDQNPLRYQQAVSLTTAINLYNATIHIDKNAKNLKIPMWIGHGDDDMVTDCDMSEAFYHKCGCKNDDKTLKIYPGKGHIIYSEEPNIYQDATEWMLRRIESNHQ